MKKKKYDLSQNGQRKPALIYFQLPPAQSNFQRKIVATIPALAYFLHISESTVKRYKSKGYIPFLQADGPHHRVLFFVDDVLKSMKHLPKKF